MVEVAICAVVWKLWKKPSLGFLFGYSFLLLAETVLIRHAFNGEHLRLELFWSWKEWMAQRNQILTNVVMFIPFGVIAGWLWKWRGLFFAVCLSVVIEVLQLITSKGICEFDDVMHNMIGAAIGIGIIMLIVQINEKYHEL